MIESQCHFTPCRFYFFIFFVRGCQDISPTILTNSNMDNFNFFIEPYNYYTGLIFNSNNTTGPKHMV